MKRTRYNFYLNPHDFYKWTKCPKCDNKTKVKKICLVIHYQEKSINYHQLLSLNKSCKYCSSCDLLIGQKPDLDPLLAQQISQTKPSLKFNADNSFVMGTMDRKDWVRGQKETLLPQQVLELMYHFKDVWDFEIQPAGWYFDG